MKFLVALLSALIPKLINIWLAHQREEGERKKTSKQVYAQRDRLKSAIDKAYDGKQVTKEQRQEVINAARSLITNY